MRVGVRSLLRAPVLTLTIVATVGPGVGATAAIFSAINAALLRPLPYARAGTSRAALHGCAAVQVPVFRRRLPGTDPSTDPFRTSSRPIPIASMSFSSSELARAAPHTRGVVASSFRCSASTPSLGRDFTEPTAGPARRRRSPSRAGRSGSAGLAGAPTSSGSRFVWMARTTRSLVYSPGLSGPLNAGRTCSSSSNSRRRLARARSSIR